MIKTAFSTACLPRLRRLTLIMLSFSFFPAIAQPPQFKVYYYIEKYAQVAIQQMVEYKIPASVTLAQAIYESSSGTSELAKKSNNHFGIKCHIGWEGDTILKDDDSTNECFRSYSKIEDSYKDHSLFLTSRSRYAELFKLPVNDYKSWCLGLKNAGYATAPNYAYQLIKLIEDTRLYELDGCETLSTEIRYLEAEPDIRPSKYTGIGFSVRDFSRAGLLWADMNDIQPRSLDFIVTGQNSSSLPIAGN
jgi:hypothetical protein